MTNTVAGDLLLLASLRRIPPQRCAHWQTLAGAGSAIYGTDRPTARYQQSLSNYEASNMHCDEQLQCKSSDAREARTFRALTRHTGAPDNVF